MVRGSKLGSFGSKLTIMMNTNNYLEKLRIEEIINLSKFVVQENFKHHLEGDLPNDYEKNVKSILKEEMSYRKNAHIFVSKDTSGNILGSVRVLKWNYVDILPLEKIFNINPLLEVEDIPLNTIWHVGRFAVKKEVKGIALFKQLLVCAAAPVCQNEGNIAFAECDSKLLRILNLLGVKATVLGEPVNYLGSETIPISMSYDGLIDFYNQNKHLVPLNILNSSLFREEELLFSVG